MQDLSYVPVNTVFRLGDFSFTVSIYTFRNVYTLSPEDTVTEMIGNRLQANCKLLLWAGGQEKEDNTSAEVNAELTGSGLRISVRAGMGRSVDVIRRVKVSLLDIERGSVINSIDVTQTEIQDKGTSITYPEGWRESGTPLVILKQQENLMVFRSLDENVRHKQFVFLPEDEHRMTVELIHEEEAVKFSSEIIVPEWEIGNVDSIEEAYREHIAFTEKKFNLKSWEERPDVPEWLRKVSLVAAIHGQHWTGHIFNDYDGMLKTAGKLAGMINPEKVLLFLPGWEGRYYWQYGDYRPDARMGGKEGFKKLIDGIHAMGFHVMPMFGMNTVGKHLEDYQRWGATSLVTSASGNRSNGSVDWDGSRHYDHASNGTVHPGAPQYRNRFCDQINELVNEYHFDAIFLDILARWSNDPNYSYYESVKELLDRIHEAQPELLISGEAWYDGLMALSPLFQCGETAGKMNFHDAAYAPMFDRYVREFGHLNQGDPAFLSTGVHELGRNPAWKTPLRKGIIPTITIIDGTLENAPERVAEIISQAETYYRTYCVK